ncbi:MAG: hypothetical protein ACTSWP_01220 [Candidatus Freyarchaeota archaeon]
MDILDTSKLIECTVSNEDLQSLIKELENVYESLLREKGEKTEEDLNLIGELYMLIVRLKKTLKKRMSITS